MLGRQRNYHLVLQKFVNFVPCHVMNLETVKVNYFVDRSELQTDRVDNVYVISLQSAGAEEVRP
jgi:hypothetical protein